MHARSLCTAAAARAFSSVAPSSLRVCWHLIIPHLGDYADFCSGLYALRYVAGAWRASRGPGTGQQRRARRRGVQSRAQAYVFNVFGWLAEAARG
jgi:hypothetical protein